MILISLFLEPPSFFCDNIEKEFVLLPLWKNLEVERYQLLSVFKKEPKPVLNSAHASFTFLLPQSGN